jgi:hypothetical protein
VDTTLQQPPEKIGDDLLRGARAIADELDCKESQVNYLFRTRKLPIGKLGKDYIASKRKLKAAFARLTG